MRGYKGNGGERRRTLRRFVVVLGSLLLFGCGPSDEEEKAADFSGNFSGDWSGTAGGDRTYLSLSQEGANVAGSACETQGMDCMEIQDGSANGRALGFSYSWIEASDGSTYTVTARLTATDESTLEGSYTSTKCDCNLPARLSRE